MTNSINLGLPYIDAAQAQKHVTHNEALRIIDTLVQLTVLDRDLTAPPGSPSNGQRWIVAASPTGAWAGHATHVAAWQDGAWQFSVPKTGWITYVADEGTLLVWNGSAWGDFFSTVTAIQNLARLGLGTTADSTNPFSAKLNNALWVAKTVADGGDGHLRYKLSKESASKTLSLLFQDNFSSRAEVGLTGDDDFHFKTSSDGSTWTDALTLDKTTGSAKVNSGFFLTGDIAPAQITADQNDYNPTGLSMASVLRLSTDAKRSITGLAGGGDGRVVSIVNVGSNGLVFKNANSSSSAGNRFAFTQDLVLNACDGAIFWYDATDSRWKLLAPRAGAREVLTANRTYYVRSDGSDSNSGLANSSAGAFLTIQKAYDVIAGTLDLGGFTVTIQIADGTYAAGLLISQPWTGGGAVTVQGNSGTAANVHISTTSGGLGGLHVTAPLPGILTIKDLKITASNIVALWHSSSGPLQFGNLVFGTTASFHIAADGAGAHIRAISAYSIVGGSAGHAIANGVGTKIECAAITITLTGTPALGTFVQASRLGFATFEANTFSGGATGTRYVVDVNGVVYVGGAGATYLPGNAAGTTGGGGQYA